MFGIGVDADAMKIVLNRADANTPIEVDEVQGVSGVEVLGRLPNDYQAVNDAYLMGGLVADTSPLGKSLSQLSERILAL